MTTPPLPQRSRFVPTRLRPGERPPQLVVAAFDGAGDVDELRDWTTITAELGSNVSLFLSGVFLLDSAHGWRYHGPGHDRGYSAIGFRKPWEEPVPELTALLSTAWLDGDDIGTHVNGHFCGPTGVDRWTEAQWTDELRQWDALVDRWQADNGITGAPPLAFDHTVSVGGRTPFTAGLQAAYATICRRAEVRCVSYRHLADWLDAQSPAVLAGLQARPAATSR